MISSRDISAVILAGGRATRMGGVDKGLVEIAGRPMVEWVVQRLSPQVSEIVVNANRSQQVYQQLGMRVVSDTVPDYQGPLAGMASAMTAVRTPWLLTVPCDSPFLPDVLVERFGRVVGDDDTCVVTAHDGVRLQPVFNLMHVSFESGIHEFLASGERKIDRWFSQIEHRTVDFADLPDTFININTPQERLEAEARL